MATILELQVCRPHPGEYEVRVVTAAAGGEPRAPLRLDVDELLARRRELEDKVVLSATAARRVVPVSEQLVQEVGQQLFDALFAGPVSGTYRASLGVARERQERLQIVLRLEAPELTLLPWETLFDSHAEAYVCRHEPMVRHLPASFTPTPLPVNPPLRILVVIASPRGLPLLDAEAERERLERALATQVNSGRVELVWLTEAKWSSLQACLMDGPWHVLHFIGHGDYDVRSEEGLVALVADDNSAHMVQASRLADLLGEANPAPRLMVLNSCASAQGGADDGFSSVGAALVRGGISAVAAMQFAVSDRASVRFSQGFYTALAHGRRVDDAVRSGRISMLGASHSLEWITPVLYVRGEATLPFNFPQTSDAGPTTKGTGPVPSADPRDKQLRVLYITARAELRIGNPGKAVELLDDFLALDPSDKEAAALRDRAVEEERLVKLYMRATEAEGAGDWSEAIERYEEILEADPEYRDVVSRRGACRDHQRIVHLQEEMRVHAEAGRWQVVIEIGDELGGLDPAGADPGGLVTRARQAIEEVLHAEHLKSLYAMALTAEGAGDWSEAIERYEEILEADPEYRDVVSRRGACRDHQRIVHLQEEMRVHAEAGRWQVVIEIGDELGGLDPAGADPGGLVTRARQAIEEVLHAEHLKSLYAMALTAEGAGDWSEAIERYEEILEADPEYKDVVSRRGACRDHQRIVHLQEEMRRQAEAGRWQAVLDVGEELGRLDPDAADPDGLFTRARQELEEARRAAESEELYERARAAERSEDWSTAIDNYRKILKAEPDYKDAVARRNACHDRQRIIHLQNKMRRQAEAGRWQAVLDVGEELGRLDPDAADPDGLFTRARQELEEARRAAESEELYERARAAERSEDWSTAISNYDALVHSGSAYKDSVQRRSACMEHARTTAEPVTEARDETAAYPAEVLLITVPCGALAWDPSGRAMAVIIGARVRVYNATGGERLNIRTGIVGDKSGPYALAFSPDGTRLVSSIRAGGAIWDAVTGKKILQVSARRRVTAAAFSPDGAFIATGDREFSNIWNASTGKRVFWRIQKSVTSVAFSPDGGKLAIADRDGLHMWSADQKIYEYRIGPINSLDFSPDGGTLAAGCEDGATRLWVTEAPIHQIRKLNHASSVKTVAFSPDGAILAAGCEDNTTCLWGVPGWNIMSVITHGSPVRSVAFSSFGIRLATGTQRAVKVWELR
ncbi:CHAT domain-containing protein [Streptomyces griseoruber]|uniref:CHAT domain-containing protein n=1 Tax=Streptomyces griseoruber TaxID=1943 RepID=UPI0037884C1E